MKPAVERPLGGRCMLAIAHTSKIERGWGRADWKASSMSGVLYISRISSLVQS